MSLCGKCPFRGNGRVYSDYKAARPESESESAPFASCPSSGRKRVPYTSVRLIGA